jgi:hypothetical protein
VKNFVSLTAIVCLDLPVPRDSSSLPGHDQRRPRIRPRLDLVGGPAGHGSAASRYRRRVVPHQRKGMQCLFSPPFTLLGYLCSLLSLSIYFTTMQLAVAVDGGDLFLFRLASSVPRNTTAARSSSGRFDGRRGKSTPSASSASAAPSSINVSAPLLIPSASTGFGRPSRALACEVEHLHWADGGALILITQSQFVCAS